MVLSMRISCSSLNGGLPSTCVPSPHPSQTAEWRSSGPRTDKLWQGFLLAGFNMYQARFHLGSF